MRSRRISRRFRYKQTSTRRERLTKIKRQVSAIRHEFDSEPLLKPNVDGDGRLLPTLLEVVLLTQ
jgi:hypothetical protein